MELVLLYDLYGHHGSVRVRWKGERSKDNVINYYKQNNIDYYGNKLIGIRFEDGSVYNFKINDYENSISEHQDK